MAKTFRLPGALRALLVLATVSLMAPQPARAGPALFDKVKSVLVGAVDADQIEMARFSINHPAEALSIYSHAASQDYPFFALVGAAKAAKGKTFPKIGTFDYAACVYPVTAVESVFSSADSMIDDAGKSDTQGVVASAQSYAAEAAKAGTKAAKDEVNKQLIEAIPYFGEITTICTFAFETDFSDERTLQLAASDISRRIQQGYDELSSGDVVSGVATLISLGVSANTACALIDNAVAGGIIGRTPLLGDLVVGACASFAGKVIDGLAGIVHGGIGAAGKLGTFAYESAKEAYCEAASWVGQDCESDAPPPNAAALGIQFCAPFGGVKIIFYQADKSPDNFTAYCNDGTSEVVKPGQPPQITTAAQAKENLKNFLAYNDNQVRQMVAFERDAIGWKWGAQCKSDGVCATQIDQIANTAAEMVLARHAQEPLEGYQTLFWKTNFYETTTAQASAAIEESKFRSQLPLWAAAFQAHWMGYCEDNVCRTGLNLVALGMNLKVAQAHQANGNLLYEQVTAPLFAQAEGNAQALVQDSAVRSAEFNKKTTDQAGEAWEVINNSIFGKQCLDQLCVSEVKKLAGLMTFAAKLVLEAGKPEMSSMTAQGIVNKEYAPKFKAVVDASKARAATKKAETNAALTSYRAAHPKPPVMSRRLWVRVYHGRFPLAPRVRHGGRPQPRRAEPTPRRADPVRPAPAPRRADPVNPVPIRIIPRVQPSPQPAPPIRIITTPVRPAPGGRPGPIVRPTPTPTPTSSPTPVPRLIRRP